MYIAGSEDIVRIIIQGIQADIRQESARDARRTYEAAHSRFGQFYGRFYRHRLSFTDTRMAFAGFIGLYGHRVQLFLVLATYCVVLGPFLLLSTSLSAR